MLKTGIFSNQHIQEDTRIPASRVGTELTHLEQLIPIPSDLLNKIFYVTIMFESTDGGERSSLFLKVHDLLLISILNICQAFYEPGAVLNMGPHRTLNAKRTRAILIFCFQGYTANLVFC